LGPGLLSTIIEYTEKFVLLVVLLVFVVHMCLDLYRGLVRNVKGGRVVVA
jgi:hypothetical protein